MTARDRALRSIKALIGQEDIMNLRSSKFVAYVFLSFLLVALLLLTIATAPTLTTKPVEAQRRCHCDVPGGAPPAPIISCPGDASVGDITTTYKNGTCKGDPSCAGRFCANGYLWKCAANGWHRNGVGGDISCP
jgi:hypothetical protein